MSTNIWFWIAFHIGVFLAIAIDLFQFKIRDRDLTIRAAARRSAIYVLLSLAFGWVVWHWQGDERGTDFLTGYLIEYSLSVDNIFVFVLIFSSFRVPPRAQHRVLLWGIIGALVMRGVMIALGSALVSRFHFILYFFGAFLIITAIRMFFTNSGQKDFNDSWVMKICRRSFPMTREYHGEHFKAKVDGRWMLTPLALCLIVIDVMDLVFAVDSIPAVFAITQDTFIVYTSNICAIIGLRSLYFMLAGMVDRFIYLKTGLAIVLAFVGIKMVAAEHFPMPRWVPLAIIVTVLGITILISMIATRNQTPPDNRNSDVA